MIRRFAPYYRPHLKLFLIDLAAALFISGVDLVFPMLSKTVINDYIPAGAVGLILRMATGIVGLYVLRMGANFFMNYWGHIVGARIEYDMRNDLFAHMQQLPFSFYDSNKTGQLMARLVGDLGEIAELAHHGPEDLFISVIMILGSFAILLTIHVRLTLIVFFFILLLLAYALFSRRAMTRAFRKVRRKHANINSQIENSISGIRLSQSFANEEYEIAKFEAGNRAHYRSKKGAYMAIATFSTGTNFLTDMVSVAAMTAGGIFAYQGQIDTGELVAYLLYASYILKPIRRLIQFTQQFQSGMAGFERFLEIMDVEPTIRDVPGAKPMDQVRGEIRFDAVDFRYSEEDTFILKGFDLIIPAGRRVALVGPSGVGKTTITNLIPRFYEVTSGQITLDGADVRELTLQSIRRNIGMVQQDVFMFYGTIRENILFGRPDATEEEIMAAADQARIHDFIAQLPQGYDTIVGERGIRLSGGQKQRLAIARVFLKNPPILILDEATSSLDNESEMAIQEAINRLSEGRTTLTIAHRLSTIIESDEIIVLTEEGITERGSHDDLLALDGLYADLYRAQFRGYIPDRI